MLRKLAVALATTALVAVAAFQMRRQPLPRTRMNDGSEPGARRCTRRTRLSSGRNTGFTNQTLRQIVHTSIGGDRVRVRLSTFGAGALHVGAAHIAVRDAGAAIVPGTDRTLTFGGQPSIVIPPGAVVLSDPAELRSAAARRPGGQHLRARKHWASDVAFRSAADRRMSRRREISRPASTCRLSRPRSTLAPDGPHHHAWFWLAGVEVMASEQTGAVAILGDSVTDGDAVDAGHQQPVAGPFGPAPLTSTRKSQIRCAEPRDLRQQAVERHHRAQRVGAIRPRRADADRRSHM